MANLVLPLNVQSPKSAQSLVQSLNAQQAVQKLNSYEIKEFKASEAGVSDQKPKMNKEDERLYSELIATAEEKSKGAVNAQFLNGLLAESRNNGKSLLVVKNVSECNMVLSIEGPEKKKLPVASNGQNALLLPKGMYLLRGNVCELKYEAQKDLNKHILVSIKRTED